MSFSNGLTSTSTRRTPTGTTHSESSPKPKQSVVSDTFLTLSPPQTVSSPVKRALDSSYLSPSAYDGIPVVSQGDEATTPLIIQGPDGMPTRPSQIKEREKQLIEERKLQILQLQSELLSNRKISRSNNSVMKLVNIMNGFSNSLLKFIPDPIAVEELNALLPSVNELLKLEPKYDHEKESFKELVTEWQNILQSHEVHFAPELVKSFHENKLLLTTGNWITIPVETEGYLRRPAHHHTSTLVYPSGDSDIEYSSDDDGRDSPLSFNHSHIDFLQEELDSESANAAAQSGRATQLKNSDYSRVVRTPLLILGHGGSLNERCKNCAVNHRAINPNLTHDEAIQLKKFMSTYIHVISAALAMREGLTKEDLKSEGFIGEYDQNAFFSKIADFFFEIDAQNKEIKNEFLISLMEEIQKLTEPHKVDGLFGLTQQEEAPKLPEEYEDVFVNLFNKLNRLNYNLKVYKFANKILFMEIGSNYAHKISGERLPPYKAIFGDKYIDLHSKSKKSGSTRVSFKETHEDKEGSTLELSDSVKKAFLLKLKFTDDNFKPDGYLITFATVANLLTFNNFDLKLAINAINSKLEEDKQITPLRLYLDGDSKKEYPLHFYKFKIAKKDYLIFAPESSTFNYGPHKEDFSIHDARYRSDFLKVDNKIYKLAENCFGVKFLDMTLTNSKDKATKKKFAATVDGKYFPVLVGDIPTQKPREIEVISQSEISKYWW